MRRGEQEYKSAIVEKESNSVEESIYGLPELTLRNLARWARF